jgi:hypothetical protein
MALFIVGESAAATTNAFGGAVKNVHVADIGFMGFSEDILIGNAPHKKGVISSGANGAHDSNFSFFQINAIWPFLARPKCGHNDLGSFIASSKTLTACSLEIEELVGTGWTEPQKIG